MTGEPILVIGGGILGLAVARELALQNSNRKVLLLEKELDIATHQTGHNSGVIHSGIYYAPDSEKAAMCREGIRLLHEFSDRHAIERRRVGKVIVATSAEELVPLEKLYERGIANQVPGLRRISQAELKEIEPAISGLKALHLPEISLVDFRKVAEAMRKDFLAGGGTVRLHRKVTAVREEKGEIRVQTDGEEYSGSYLVNCAGLYCDVIAEKAGCDVPARIVPFRGEYFCLHPDRAAQIRGLVYPVADEKLPFLGVHLTPTLKGEVTVGPNAVLALAREGYRWRDINLGELVGCFSYAGFWRMAARYWKTGIFEIARSLVKSLYAASVRKFLPDLRVSDLLPGGSGVRAQAVAPDGQLIQDFLYVRQERAVHVLNAPSPAATASLAIAKRIATLI